MSCLCPTKIHKAGRCVRASVDVDVFGQRDHNHENNKEFKCIGM